MVLATGVSLKQRWMKDLLQGLGTRSRLPGTERLLACSCAHAQYVGTARTPRVRSLVIPDSSSTQILGNSSLTSFSAICQEKRERLPLVNNCALQSGLGELG